MDLELLSTHSALAANTLSDLGISWLDFEFVLSPNLHVSYLCRLCNRFFLSQGGFLLILKLFVILKIFEPVQSSLLFVLL